MVLPVSFLSFIKGFLTTSASRWPHLALMHFVLLPITTTMTACTVIAQLWIQRPLLFLPLQTLLQKRHRILLAKKVLDVVGHAALKS